MEKKVPRNPDYFFWFSTQKKKQQADSKLKKDNIFGETKLGPSYFVRALVYFYTMDEIIKMD